MAGSIERLRRQLTALAAPTLAVPMLLVIGVPTRPDPINKRLGGTAGVIAIPGASASAPSSSAHGDLVSVDGRRDTRADRGRVLYSNGSNGSAPRDTAAARPAHKPCPNQRVVQARIGGVAPTV